MTLHQLLPQPRETTLNEVLALAHETQRTPFVIGAEETIKFCADISQKLLQDERTKAFPELAALGFWLRTASIRHMLRDYLPALAQACRAPVGIVLQLPPGNVPTLFLYSAILSLLCGNTTLVRLSDKNSPSLSLLVDIIGACLTNAPLALRNRLIVLRYGHDDAITTTLSRSCDLRLIWGGDATVSHIRSLPLSPLANEIAFGDRFSASAINAATYSEADTNKREKLVHQFYNDLFWFDQFACASPRLLLWLGSPAQTAPCAADFYDRLSRRATDKNYQPVAGANLAKLNMAYLALHDLPVTSYRVHSPALTVITVSDLSVLTNFKPINYGFGLLLTTQLNTLSDLAPYVERRDQTLTFWGVSDQEREDFIRTCNGRGFDRIVPIGQALDFNPIWDGHNLFTAMTRLVQTT